MKDNYKSFLNCITSKVQSFKDFQILFDLFEVKKNSNINKEIIWELIRLFSDKRIDRNLTLIKISEFCGTLLKLTSKDEYYYKHLLKGIQINFNDEDINNIYINILNNKELNLDNEIIDILMKNICKNSNDLTNKSIINLLNKFSKNKEMQIYFLEKQRKEIITEKDIYSLELTENLDFISNLMNNGFFKDNYKNVNFIMKTREFMNLEIKKLINSNFSFEQLKIMYKLDNSKNSHNNLKMRLTIICLGAQNISDKLYCPLIKKINFYHKIYESYKKIINIFSSYYPHEKNKKIDFYKNIIDFINENPINKFPELNQNFTEDYKLAEEIYELKSSKIFIIIFNIFRNKFLNEEETNDSIYIDKTKMEFNNLIKLFNSESEDEVNFQLLKEIIEKLEIEEIEKEIKLLSNILKTNLNLNKNIIEKIILFKKKPKKMILLKKIILLLNDFKFEGTNTKEILEKSKENLENLSSFKKLIEIDKKLKELNLKILNPELNKESLTVIDKMYDKPELIKFFKDKAIKEIHQMGEFIDDSEDVFIKYVDLSYLEECINWIH